MTACRSFACLISRAALLAAALLLGASSPATQQGISPTDRPAAAPPQNPIQPGRALILRGVPNFGQVSATLYRGGQPTAEGLQELKKLGIGIVVNFRDEREHIEAERPQVEGLGLRYVSIPWSSLHKPENGKVAEFLELLRANPEKKVFVHCHYGADRTGVMVALYRIAGENWTPQDAIEEMKAFHFHNFWLPHLRKYVRDFPQRLAADPQLRALRPAALATTP